ncbi:MAG: hypothetical protein DRO39_05365 [Thermoprotei archaeon]|nr:MAG: hypothetical protein DRO39_05365 [Thermoprotei archaeon]
MLRRYSGLVLRTAREACKRLSENGRIGGDAEPLLRDVSIDEGGQGWLRVVCRDSSGRGKLVLVLVDGWRPAVIYLEG